MSSQVREGIRQSDYTVNAAGCWIWNLFIDASGYGSVRSAGRTWYAHRFAWTVLRGPIPEGMHIDHLCFQPSCVNPDHLRVVQPLVNMRNHRAAFKTHCAQGHEFTTDNTGIGKRRDGRTYRMCKTCRNAASRVRGARWRAERKAS